MRTAVGLDLLGADPEPIRTKIRPSTVGAVLGAIAGGLLVKRRVIGVFAGAGAGGSLAVLLTGGSLTDAGAAVGFAAGGYAVHQIWEASPIAGFAAGAILGDVAIEHAVGKSLTDTIFGRR